MLPKPILACADDFGLHPAVDAAILTLAARGRLNAASCLVDGQSFRRHGAALRDSGMQCGLHLNFTERLENGAGIVPLRSLVRSAWLRRLDTATLRLEVVRQLDTYEATMGRAPDYVDGHQHVHQFPQIRDVLVEELASRYASVVARPWLRCTLAGRQSAMPPEVRLKSCIIGMLGARALRRLARRHGFRCNRALLGVYAFRGGEAGYGALLQRWLTAAQEGDLIMCHPATEVVAGDALGAQRQAEFNVWNSDEAADWLRRNGLVLDAAAAIARGFGAAGAETPV